MYILLLNGDTYVLVDIIDGIITMLFALFHEIS
jgi:hypothetical protein